MATNFTGGPIGDPASWDNGLPANGNNGTIAMGFMESMSLTGTLAPAGACTVTISLVAGNSLAGSTAVFGTNCAVVLDDSGGGNIADWGSLVCLGGLTLAVGSAGVPLPTVIGAVQPAGASHVRYGQTNLGVAGACHVPAKADVKDGVAVDVSDLGEYPTTEATQAAQLAADIAEVNTHLESIDGGEVVLTGSEEGTGMNIQSLLEAIYGRAVLRTSQITDINNDGVTDDSTLINAAVEAFSAAGGGVVLWDGCHAFMHSFVYQSNCHFEMIDDQPRLIYFGAAAGGTDDLIVRNAHLIRGFPVRGTCYDGDANPVAMPIALAADLAVEDLSMTLYEHQGAMIANLIPCFFTITWGGGSEDVYATERTGDTLTIERAQRGSVARLARTQHMGAPAATVVPTIIDENVTFGRFTIDCQGQTFTDGNTTASYPDDYIGCIAFLGLGIRNLRIENLRIIDRPSYGLILGNLAGQCAVQSYRVDYVRTLPRASLDNSCDFWGPFEHLDARGCRLRSGDNSLGMNWASFDTVPGPFTGFLAINTIASAGDVGYFFGDDIDIAQDGALPGVSLLGSANTIAHFVDFARVRVVGGALSEGGPFWEQGSATGSLSKIGTLRLREISFSGNVATAADGPLLIRFSPGSEIANFVVDGFDPSVTMLDTNHPLALFTVGTGAHIGTVRLAKIGRKRETVLIYNAGTIASLLYNDTVGNVVVSGNQPTAIEYNGADVKRVKTVDADTALTTRAAAALDVADGIETGVTFRQALRWIAAILVGKVSGARTGSETFSGVGGSTPRVRVTADEAGNRSAVTILPD